MSDTGIQRFKTYSRFGYAMGTNLLCAILWFIMSWDPLSLVQIITVVSTGFLVSDAAVDWKHPPKDLTNT